MSGSGKSCSVGSESCGQAECGIGAHGPQGTDQGERLAGHIPHMREVTRCVFPDGSLVVEVLTTPDRDEDTPEAITLTPAEADFARDGQGKLGTKIVKEDERTFENLLILGRLMED